MLYGSRKAFARLLTRDERGVAAIEFAFIASVLVILLIGMTDVGQRILDRQRLDSVAAHLGDLITQESTLTQSKLTSLLQTVPHYAGRQGKDSDNVVIVTGVVGQANGNTKVAWQQTGAGTLNEPSRIGALGAKATLPPDFTLAEGKTIVAVEVVKKQQSILSNVGGANSVTVRTAYLRGRKGELASLSN